MAKVTTLGTFMMDLVAYTPRRPNNGETIRGESFSIALGGKGFNQAIAAGRAGVQSAMLGNLGTDGFGLSDTRGALRRHFKVDGESITVAALAQLAAEGEIKSKLVNEALEKYRLTDISAADPGNTDGAS